MHSNPLLIIFQPAQLRCIAHRSPYIIVRLGAADNLSHPPCVCSTLRNNKLMHELTRKPRLSNCILAYIGNHFISGLLFCEPAHEPATKKKSGGLFRFFELGMGILLWSTVTINTI